MWFFLQFLKIMCVLALMYVFINEMYNLKYLLNGRKHNVSVVHICQMPHTSHPP